MFSLADSKLLRYPSAYSGGDYTIPNDVKIIGYEAFADCLNLNSVDIPNSVTTIEGVALLSVFITIEQPKLIRNIRV